MDQKKILFLIDSLGYGGAENLLLICLNHLDKAKFNPAVCVFTNRSGNPIGEEIKKLGIEVDFIPIKNLRDITAIFKLVRYLRRNNFDLVHTQLSFANTLGCIASKLVNIPCVSTLHTLKKPIKKNSSYWRYRIMGWSLKYFCNRIIAVSEATKIHHLDTLNLPEKKMVTLYNGIEIDKLPKIGTKEKFELRKSLGILPKIPLLITVAVLREDKGIQYMLKAIPELIKVVPDAIYLIVGDGDYRQYLENLVTGLGIQDHVRFVGYKKEIYHYMLISDLFILPSLTEALPTVLAEAMACGLPVVATTVGGIPEMIKSQYNGILVPPKNSEMLANVCANLLVEVKKVKKLSEVSKDYVYENFDIKKQIKLLEEIYAEYVFERK